MAAAGRGRGAAVLRAPQAPAGRAAGADLSDRLDAGVSRWWATPAEPTDHFSTAQLARSAAVHGPLRRVAVAAWGARIVLLAVAVAIGRGLAEPGVGVGVGDGGGFAGRSLWATATAPTLLVAAAAVTVAFRLPATVADAWFEYRLPDRLVAAGVLDPADRSRPVPVGAFAATAAMVTGLWLVALVVVAAVVYRLAAATAAWPVLVVAFLALVTIGYSTVEAVVRRRLPGGERALVGPGAGLDAGADRESSARVERELRDLADRFDLAAVGFATASRLGGDRPGAAAGSNACAIGFGVNRRVVLTGSLLAGDRRVREFVVAHELTHLARRHLVAHTAVVLGCYGVVAGAVGLAMATGQPFTRLGVAPLDPAGLPIVVAIALAAAAICAPVASFVFRHHERVADLGAIAAVGPLERSTAAALQASVDADLAPPWFVRLLAGHPAPAERLEFLARHRRLEPAERLPFGPRGLTRS